MVSDELRAEAVALRAAGRTPKQIARELGLTRAVVGPLVRGVEVERPGRSRPGDLPLLGCWISPGWSEGLLIEDRPDDWVDVDDDGSMTDTAGLASVLVARREGAAVSLVGFLVDTYCLGAKNALAPSAFDERDVSAFADEFFGSYEALPLPAPIDLAQHLVFGAVEFARGIGFDPHPDYYSAAGHLGEWQPPSRITFGRDGTPFFLQGPNDNAERIMRVLDRSVGAGNYHYTTVVG
ncbi:hypothetical protein [Micromonospora sp. WMMD980]|uniref:hypothetical protein n=1 Tax=Micromonospora sp. WMMD980 TaxID=3016088 RepID=UPI0024165213|nr:hypothetical protein [Micromonospora sp. WMMD980]MDG4799328.1 hypothetical protein [Micromonospora sp. WMMD980]